jgi:hypothetical protein
MGAASVLAALLAGVPSASAAAAATEVTLSTPPGPVVLALGESARVPVVVANPGPAPVDASSLEVFAPPGVHVEPHPPPGNRLDAGASEVWVLHLERTPEGHVGPVHLVLHHLHSRGDGEAPIPGVAVAQLQVEEAAVPAAGAVAEVATRSALKVLEDRRQGGLVFLVVTNTSAFPVEVTRVRSYKPDFVALHPLRIPDGDAAGESARKETAEPDGKAGRGGGPGRPAFELPVTVPPGQSKALPYTMTAEPPVEPGEHAVLWEVELAWEQGGRRHSGTLVAEHAFTVSVLGGSALLEAVNVPSLLMLPGALMVMTVVFLRRHWAPRVESRLTVVNPEFWLIAVALSIGAAYAYRWITAWLGKPRDYLARYGLEDIFRLWLGSLAAGLLIYLGWMGGAALWRRLGARRRARLVPAPTDRPSAALRKLARTENTLVLPQIRWQVEGGTQQAFELARAEGGTLWVAPPITVEWHGEGGSWRTQVDDLVAKDDPQALAALLENGEKEGRLRALWKPVGPLGLHGPTAVAFADDDPPQQEAPRRIVET